MNEKSDMPQIPREVGRIDKALAEVMELATKMEERLTPVMQVAQEKTPCDSEVCPEGAPPSSQLAGDLQRVVSRLRHVARSMEDMLGRIEV